MTGSCDSCWWEFILTENSQKSLIAGGNLVPFLTTGSRCKNPFPHCEQTEQLPEMKGHLLFPAIMSVMWPLFHLSLLRGLQPSLRNLLKKFPMLPTPQSLQGVYFLLSQAGENFPHNIHPEYAPILQFKYTILFLSITNMGKRLLPFCTCLLQYLKSVITAVHR